MKQKEPQGPLGPSEGLPGGGIMGGGLLPGLLGGGSFLAWLGKQVGGLSTVLEAYTMRGPTTPGEQCPEEVGTESHF